MKYVFVIGWSILFVCFAANGVSIPRKPSPAGNQCVSSSKHRVDRSACITPSAEATEAFGGAAPKEVGIIYLHGLMGSGGLNHLESQNRQKLQELADRMNVMIAAPLQTKGTLATIEASARETCGNAKLAQGKSMIGFSDGGLTVRNLALRGAFQKPHYANVMTTGAEVKIGAAPVKTANPARLIVTAEKRDHGAGSGSCVASGGQAGKGCTPFAEAIKGLKKSFGSETVGQVFSTSCEAVGGGGHILPDAAQLEEFFTPPGTKKAQPDEGTP